MAIMADVPDNVLFRVLNQRIHLTNLMPCIHDVNSKDANDHLKFVLAEEDWKQWKVSVNFPLSAEFKSLVCQAFPSILNLDTVWESITCQIIQWLVQHLLTTEVGILKTIICQGSGSPTPEGGLKVFEHLPGMSSVRDMLKVGHLYQSLKRVQISIPRTQTDFFTFIFRSFNSLFYAF